GWRGEGDPAVPPAGDDRRQLVRGIRLARRGERGERSRRRIEREVTRGQHPTCLDECTLAEDAERQQSGGGDGEDLDRAGAAASHRREARHLIMKGGEL